MDGAIQTKSFAFAIRIVNLCKYLQTEKKEYIMAKQLLRCGTSIGANIAESQQAQSTPDFVNIADCNELERLLISIIKSAKK